MQSTPSLFLPDTFAYNFQPSVKISAGEPKEIVMKNSERSRSQFKAKFHRIQRLLAKQRDNRKAA